MTTPITLTFEQCTCQLSSMTRNKKFVVVIDNHGFPLSNQFTCTVDIPLQTHSRSCRIVLRDTCGKSCWGTPWSRQACWPDLERFCETVHGEASDQAATICVFQDASRCSSRLCLFIQSRYWWAETTWRYSEKKGDPCPFERNCSLLSKETLVVKEASSLSRVSHLLLPVHVFYNCFAITLHAFSFRYRSQND